MAGIGSMQETIDLITPVARRDAAGFTASAEQVVASVRAYRQMRHASSAWVNRAAYTQATVLFRIRTIPGLPVSEVMHIAAADGRYVIDTHRRLHRDPCPPSATGRSPSWRASRSDSPIST